MKGEMEVEMEGVEGEMDGEIEGMEQDDESVCLFVQKQHTNSYMWNVDDKWFKCKRSLQEEIANGYW